MLKKMMKAVLTIALVAGMSSVAMAEAQVGGSVKAFFGQYSSGADGASGYFRGVSESNINFSGQTGPIKVHSQLELEDTSNAGYLHNTQRSAAYQMNDQLGFKIGTNVTGVPFSIVSGFKTHTVPAEFIGVYSTFAEADGLGISYKATDTINAGLTIYGVDTLRNPFGEASGSTNTISANGAFGAIAFKFNYAMGTSDAHDGSDTASDSGMDFGVKYSMDMLSVSLDVFSKTLGEGDAQSGNAIQLQAAAGPGKVIATIASIAKMAAKKGADVSWTNVGYDISLDKGAGLMIAYTSEAVADGNTASFIGAGFYAGF